MKKNFFLISLLVFVFISACKKDKDDPSPFDAKYTDETSEESKAKVEENAINFVDKLDQMSSTTAIEILMNLKNLTGNERYAFSPISAPLVTMASTDRSGTKKVFDAMKSAGEMLAEDPISFSNMFDSIAGKYTYDFQTGEFIESELADKVIIEFPGRETDLTNTAVLTIDNFTLSEVTDPFEEWPSDLDPELPASFDIDLLYNGTSIAGMTFDADYQSDGLPVNVSVELYVDDFTFKTTATHSAYTSASWTNTLKFQDEILIETYISASGNWTEENIDDNVTEVTYTDEWETWTETEVNFEEIVNNANAHLILMNMKIAGMVNIKDLADAMKELEDEQLTEEEYVQAGVDAINANAKLVVIYRDSNKKVASAEAYVVSEYNTYYDEYEYYPGFRFVYADGSKVDATTYLESELDGFFESLNDFIDKLNAEYNLDLDPVEPPQDKL